MSRQHYSNSSQQVDYFRRPARTLALTATRSYSIGNRENYSASNQESDSDRPSRRRIAVAVCLSFSCYLGVGCYKPCILSVCQCSRCRKRKIKCSGDMSNGQGCLNCKNAGSDPGTCRFLRACVTSALAAFKTSLTPGR